jgi:8-oxo-dGTP pyrophosphatase MutT (NUDIX family)
MTRDDLRLFLPDMDLAASPCECECRERMLHLLDEPRCFQRDCFPAHFTGSALVVSHDGARALLHHHRFLGKWLQFGGHCDGDEDILRVAVREAAEESGITGLITTSPRPFDIDIHPIPENPKRGEPPHEHFDVRYILIAPEGAEPVVSDESHDIRWFTPGEALALALDASLVRMVEKWRALLARRAAPKPVP